MHAIWHAVTLWDRHTFLAINNGLKCPFLDAVMPSISDLGLGHVQILIVLVAAVLMGIRRREIAARTLLPDLGRTLSSRRRWIVPLMVAFALSGIASTVVKRSVDRDRPAWFYEQEHTAGRSLSVHVHTDPWRHPLEAHGFLSGHTATSVALAMTFSLIAWRRRALRKWTALAWTYAFLVSLSRIYIADHWPVDVVAGTLLGIASGCLAVWLCRSLIGNPVVEQPEVEPDSGQGSACAVGTI